MKDIKDTRLSFISEIHHLSSDSDEALEKLGKYKRIYKTKDPGLCHDMSIWEYQIKSYQILVRYLLDVQEALDDIYDRLESLMSGAGDDRATPRDY